MESNQQARRSPVARPDAELRKEQREEHDAANREKVEAMSSPEAPTPTQAEADAMKEGVEQQANADTAAQQREREQARQRDVRPGAQASGYQTR